jgi:hypothetical protein
MQIWRNEPNFLGFTRSARSSAACPARAAPPGAKVEATPGSPIASSIDALCDIEHDINGLSAEKRLAAHLGRSAPRGWHLLHVHERLA